MKKLWMFTVVSLFVFGVSAPANALLLDLNGAAPGGQVINFDYIDWSPDSALAENGLRAIANFNTNQTNQTPLQLDTRFDLYSMATAIDFRLGGTEIDVIGLGSDFEITIVGGFTEKVVTSSFDPGTGIASADFFLADTTTSNYFEMYLDTSVNADYVLDDGSGSAGTGYNDGVLIMRGEAEVAYGNFSAQTQNIQTLDGYNADSLGQDSITGGGFSFIDVDIRPFFINYDYFIEGDNILELLIDFTTTNSDPYTTVDPATLFNNVPLSGTATLVPNLGDINGLSGPDFQFQTDANSSITATVVPEPSTFILLGAGLLGLGGLGIMRRKKR